MGVQITIRNVPESIRDELASRAAREGRYMQEFLRAALESIASKPSPEQWVSTARARKSLSGTRFSAEEIVQAQLDGPLDQDRH